MATKMAEPKERYINLYWGKDGPYLVPGVHTTKGSADALANSDRIACLKIAFVVEVV